MDAELVKTITERVMSLLKEQGLPAAPAPPAAPKPAPTKRRNITSASVQRKPGGAEKPGEVAPLGKVFLTAESLRNRLAASDKGGTIELACNEFLTPNAADFAEARRLSILRAPAPLLPPAPSLPGNPREAPGPASSAKGACPTVSAAPAAGRKIGVVIAKADEKVRTLLEALARDNLNLLDYNRSDCWIANLLGLCRDVAGGELGAGTAIVPYPANAMVLAGKVKGVRPVQGAAPEGVTGAMRSFGANLLILEPASSTYHQMRTMIRVLATGESAAEGSALLSALKELEG